MPIFGYRLNAPIDLGDTPISSIRLGQLKQFFIDTTTAHGIPQWLRARGYVKNLVWTLVMIGTLVGLVRQLRLICLSYLDYEVTIDIKIHTTHGLKFPAVTICNMNPVKKSALESGNSVLSNLIMKDTEQTNSRKKRAITMSCTDPAQIHVLTGLCFGLGTYYLRLKYDGRSGADFLCNEHYGGGVAMVNTYNKWAFLKNNPLMRNISSPWYWIGIKNGMWFNSIPVNQSSFTAYAPGHPDPGKGQCVIVDTKAGHRWENAHCKSIDEMYLPLCQQMVQCPWKVYRDEASSPHQDVCYFLLDGALTLTYPEAEKACGLYDKDSTLVTLDTPEKLDHLSKTGLLNYATSDEYWLYMEEGKWRGKDEVTWSYWQSGDDNHNRCATAHRDREQAWTDTDCQRKALVLCQWRDDSIPYVPYVPGTTIEPSTAEQTAESQTTIAPTTAEPSTLQQTTELPTTLPRTTETMPPTTTVPAPTSAPHHQPINGSRFPERIRPREEFREEEKAIAALAAMPIEDKASMGYKPDEFLLDCQYNGYACSPTKDFVSFYNGIHGNCYIFNSGWDPAKPILSSDRTGRRYGLKMVVNIGQDEYTEMFGEHAGARVVVHAQDRMPFPEDEGILVRPGLLTTIGVRKVRHSRLPHPYSDCSVYDPHNINYTRNMYEELYPVRYTSAGCLKTCYQGYVIAECGCGDPYYPREALAFPTPAVPICNINNIKEDDCKYGVAKRFMLNQLDCNCPSSCEEEAYMPTVSTAQWPSDAQVKFVRAALHDKVPNLFRTENDTKYQQNLIKLEVQYEDLNYEKVTEKRAYVEFQFMSNIGGTLGLWFGFSLITSFEMLEFALDALVVVCLRTFCRGDSEKQRRSRRRSRSRRRRHNRSASRRHTKRRAPSGRNIARNMDRARQGSRLWIEMADFHYEMERGQRGRDVNSWLSNNRNSPPPSYFYARAPRMIYNRF